jgi:hypothetical protein
MRDNMAVDKAFTLGAFSVSTKTPGNGESTSTNPSFDISGSYSSQHFVGCRPWVERFIENLCLQAIPHFTCANFTGALFKPARNNLTQFFTQTKITS